MLRPSTARFCAQAMGAFMVDIPENPDARLTRERVAAALTALGYPVSPRTLATKATRGGGPPYTLFGRRALYRWGDALAWAESLTTPPRRCTAEADGSRSAA
jgi:hypothetical protein